MKRYKEGDKVRIIKKENGHHFEVGDIVVIDFISKDEGSEDTYYGVTDGIRRWSVTSDEIEPHEKAPEIKTRDKNYTGCHPQIAEALKQGKEVYCKVWDDEYECRYYWVSEYKFNSDYPYRTNGPNCEKAEPYTPKVKVKKASEIVKWLEDNGYEIDSDGIWNVKRRPSFRHEMFYYCGKEKPEKFNWLPEWLEEV